MTAKQIGNAAYALFYQFAGQSDSQHNFSPSSNDGYGDGDDSDGDDDDDNDDDDSVGPTA